MDCRFLLLCFLALVAAQSSSNITSPLACINGPRSNCTTSWQPGNLTLNFGELTNLTLPLPCLPVLSYSFNGTASNGIDVTVGSLANTSVILAVQDFAGNGGNVTFFVEWCDASGYGSRSTTVEVITNTTALACINGPPSNCTNSFQPLTVSLNAGQLENVTLNLPCLPVLQYFVSWSSTNNGTGATVGLLSNTSISLAVQDLIGNGGIITVYVQWCDASGFGNQSTTVTLIPNRSVTVTPTPTAT
jgi:hypothetical protein